MLFTIYRVNHLCNNSVVIKLLPIINQCQYPDYVHLCHHTLNTVLQNVLKLIICATVLWHVYVCSKSYQPPYQCRGCLNWWLGCCCSRRYLGIPYKQLSLKKCLPSYTRQSNTKWDTHNPSVAVHACMCATSAGGR